MKNKFEIRGDITAIFFYKKGEILETIIDTACFEKANEFPNTWVAHDRYVSGAFSIGKGRQKFVHLHRWLTNCPIEKFIDHINHDSYDNRISNLRFVSNSENLQNYKGAHKHNKTSGLRGVCWSKSHKKWRAYLHVNKKAIHVGYFDDIKEAELSVKEARAKFMPYSLDALGGI